MRHPKVNVGSFRDDAWRSAAEVNAFNGIDINCLCDAGLLIQIAGIRPQVRIVADLTFVAFELAVIGYIKSNQGGKLSPVGFCDVFTTEVSLVR